LETEIEPGGLTPRLFGLWLAEKRRQCLVFDARWTRGRNQDNHDVVGDWIAILTNGCSRNVALGTMGLIRKTFLALSVVAAVALVAASRVGNRDREALCGGVGYESHSVRPGSPPYIELTADGVSGHFLLDYGATRSSLSASVFAPSTDALKSVKLSLPGFDHGVFELKRYDLPPQAADRQVGVIGTDFLSLLTVQITESAVFLGEQPCQPATMRARGFVPISQDHFFSSDPSAVDARLPNVPIVFLRLGATQVWAQIDTGYDDAIYPHSVDINQALYERLIKDGMRLRQVSRITVSTCEGQ